MAIRVTDTAYDTEGSRAMDARKANDRIAEKAAQLRFVSRVPMLCECSSPGCRTVVMVGLDEYRRIREDGNAYLTAPGHDADRSELQERRPNYEIRRETNGDRRSA
jgi:hypothetical protein